MNFKSGGQISENFYEMTKTPTSFVEKYPLHCGTAVLHMSKLILLKFVKFLYDFLIPNSYEVVYSDTDSMCLVLEDKMSELVRPEKKDEWEEASKLWFVRNHDDAWDLRCPGKMKLEWGSTNGAIVA